MLHCISSRFLLSSLLLSFSFSVDDSIFPRISTLNNIEWNVSGFCARKKNEGKKNSVFCGRIHTFRCLDIRFLFHCILPCFDEMYCYNLAVFWCGFVLFSPASGADAAVSDFMRPTQISSFKCCAQDALPFRQWKLSRCRECRLVKYLSCSTHPAPIPALDLGSSTGRNYESFVPLLWYRRISLVSFVAFYIVICLFPYTFQAHY